MRRNNLLIFDDFVMNPQSGTPVFTSCEFDARLGAYDTLAVQAVLGNVSVTTASLSVYQYHSADGWNWLQKALLFTVPTSLTTQMGADTSGVPTLALVKIGMY